MDITLILQARGFFGCYEAGALDFLYLALECAYRAGLPINLRRLLTAHTGALSGLFFTSSLTAAHQPLSALFSEGCRINGPNSLYHAWVDLPLPHSCRTAALHSAISSALSYVPEVVLSAAGPPVRALPEYAQGLIVCVSKGVLQNAPRDLLAGAAAVSGSATASSVDGAGNEGDVQQQAQRNRLVYDRPRPDEAKFLVLDDARTVRRRSRRKRSDEDKNCDRTSLRRQRRLKERQQPELSIYTSSLRVEQSWARYRSIATDAATAPEILSAVLSACKPGYGDLFSANSLFRSIAPDEHGWRDRLLKETEMHADWDGIEEDGASRCKLTISIDTSDIPTEDKRREEDIRFSAPYAMPEMSGSDMSSSEGDHYVSQYGDNDDEEEYRLPRKISLTLRPRSPRGEGPTCLACHEAGPLGAALTKSVRLHDFLLGRHNMQQALLETLRDARTGDSIFPLCGAAALEVPLPEWPQLNAGEQKNIQRQTKRICDSFISEWHSAMKDTANTQPRLHTSVTVAHANPPRSRTLHLGAAVHRVSKNILRRLYFSLTGGLRKPRAASSVTRSDVEQHMLEDEAP